MTLRVLIQIIPFGDETKARTIETLNISNVSFIEGDNNHDKYVIEHNDYKNYNEKTPRVYHKREEGALVLVQKALQIINE